MRQYRRKVIGDDGSSYPAMQRHWAAGVLPVAIVDGEPAVLLGRDAGFKGGRWSDFTGGGEPGDATTRHTAVRELFEETSGALEMRPEDLEGALELLGTTPSGKALVKYAVHVRPGAVGAFEPNEEKTAIAWFPLGRLPRMRRAFEAQMRDEAAAIAAWLRTEGREPRATGPFDAVAYLAG